MGNFQQEIYSWFRRNKRLLPWRGTKDPYKIWISEIVLQQTRVKQGIGYYNRFIEAFPGISQLAGASEDSVLKIWQGLGYYSRARNLHAAAKYIVEHYNGKFPSSYKLILNLKGIGHYTAAAISSIAFDLPYPAVDGNVYRLLSRYYGVDTPIDTSTGKKEFDSIAMELLGSTDPGFHNQAMMEFGALQCTPGSPDCRKCPLNRTCYAFQNGKVDLLPVKSKKIVQKNRYFLYYFIEHGEFTYLEKRRGKDIWKNLYQFPLTEHNGSLSEKEIIDLPLPFSDPDGMNLKSVSAEIKHILSHQIIFARFIHLEAEKEKSALKNLIQVNKKDIYKFAVPGILEQFIDNLKFGSLGKGQITKNK